MIALTVAVLGLIILGARERFRSSLRQQMMSHHAQLFHSLLVNQYFRDAFGVFTDDPADQLMAVLETSQLPELSGVSAMRLFDKKGAFVMPFPEYVPDADDLPPSEMLRLLQHEPVIEFHPEMSLAALSWLYVPEPGSPPATTPVLEVLIPLHRPSEDELLGIVQLLLDGRPIEKAFAALDASLNRTAWGAFLGAGSLIGLALGLAFRRLHQVNRLLTERTQSLLQANQELALAAKTSAIGAVTAHLIHGLKNPLFGLQSFVSQRRTRQEDQSDVEWDSAVNSTRRMQSMVNEIVRVLREQEIACCYELSIEEVAETVAARVQPVAEEANVRFHWTALAEGRLSNREANLVSLILENLLTNAIEATPSGKSVTLKADCAPGAEVVEWVVSDQGPGLPGPVCQRLFSPCRSEKEGGSGIGLSISKQLANQLGAGLELKESSSSGTIFVFTLPLRTHGEKEYSASMKDPA